MCFVYIIGPEDGPYKIGLSGNVYERIEEIQATSPVKLFLLGARKLDSRFDAVGFERQVHSALKEHRMHNEWFNCELAAAKLAIRAKLAPRRISAFMEMALEYAQPEYRDV